MCNVALAMRTLNRQLLASPQTSKTAATVVTSLTRPGAAAQSALSALETAEELALSPSDAELVRPYRHYGRSLRGRTNAATLRRCVP